MVELIDLIDMDMLIRLQKRFTEILGFNVAFAGLNYITLGQEQMGKRVHRQGSFCDRICKHDEKMCYKSDEEAGKIAKDEGRTVLYTCQGFCSNFVIPIKVVNDVIGYLYSGQFFALEPKNDYENNEWQILESQYCLVKEDGEYIHSLFFLDSQGRPTDSELRKVAINNGFVLKPEIEDFIRLYRTESNPETSKSVKSAVEVLHDINILSEIANAISEECNTKYALKTHFEVSQKIREMKRKKIYKKRIKTNYVNLCNKIEKLLMSLKQKEKDPTIGHCEMINDIDKHAIEILKIIKEQENHHLHKEFWLKNLIFLENISKRDELRGLIDILKPIPTKKNELSSRQQKAELLQQIDKIREFREKIKKLWLLIGPITWILVILAIISIVFMVIR